ncbi:MAG TPA: hypothetical protein VGD62_11615 [Acidobacteriaceae bacterium]
MSLDVRRLVAIDLALLGPWLILPEFALGVAGPWVLGALTLRMAGRHGWPAGLTLFGLYLVSLGVNYVPMLLHAVGLVRSRGARQEVAEELEDRPAAMRRYRRQSMWLLAPGVVPVVALRQRGRSGS